MIAMPVLLVRICLEKVLMDNLFPRTVRCSLESRLSPTSTNEHKICHRENVFFLDMSESDNLEI
jgi:hypothetical protein